MLDFYSFASVAQYLSADDLLNWAEADNNIKRNLQQYSCCLPVNMSRIEQYKHTFNNLIVDENTKVDRKLYKYLGKAKALTVLNTKLDVNFARLCRLERLVVRNAPFMGDFLKLRRLTFLELEDLPLGSGIENLTNLTSLTIKGMNPHVHATLCRMENLQTLKVTCYKDEMAAAGFNYKFAGPPNLTTLTLCLPDGDDVFPILVLSAIFVKSPLKHLKIETIHGGAALFFHVVDCFHRIKHLSFNFDNWDEWWMIHMPDTLEDSCIETITMVNSNNVSLAGRLWIFFDSLKTIYMLKKNFTEPPAKTDRITFIDKDEDFE